jgi:hypothetical protein
VTAARRLATVVPMAAGVRVWTIPRGTKFTLYRLPESRGSDGWSLQVKVLDALARHDLPGDGAHFEVAAIYEAMSEPPPSVDRRRARDLLEIVAGALMFGGKEAWARVREAHTGLSDQWRRAKLREEVRRSIKDWSSRRSEDPRPDHEWRTEQVAGLLWRLSTVHEAFGQIDPGDAESVVFGSKAESALLTARLSILANAFGVAERQRDSNSLREKHVKDLYARADRARPSRAK